MDKAESTARPGSSPAAGNPHKWVVCRRHDGPPVRYVASYKCPICRWHGDAESKHRYIEEVRIVPSGGASGGPRSDD